jgi:hypothetical protein
VIAGLARSASRALRTARFPVHANSTALTFVPVNIKPSGSTTTAQRQMEDAKHVIGLRFITLAVLANVWFYDEQKQGPSDNAQPHIEQGTPHPDALELLKERYARGQAGRQEYLEKRPDIEK